MVEQPDETSRTEVPSLRYPKPKRVWQAMQVYRRFPGDNAMISRAKPWELPEAFNMLFSFDASEGSHA